jgi:tRNA pseudouridine55 synthase
MALDATLPPLVFQGSVRYPPYMRHGFLLIDKPTGITSHDVVGIARKTLSERSIGHLGTLDPEATGLLVLAVGKKALKVVEFFSHLQKQYEAEVTLGAVSTTYDREGVIEQIPNKAGWEIPETGTVQRIIQDRFLGKISQVPPQFSAVHVGGERAYRKAQRGIGVNIPPRDVEIHRCDILSFEYPKLKLLVDCGSGTYIRSLANDLGESLRCGGYLSALRRTEVGEWSVKDAKAPDAVAWSDVIPLKDILEDFPKIELTADEAEDVRNGRVIERDVQGVMFGWFEDLPICQFESKGEGFAHARKVF